MLPIKIENGIASVNFNKTRKLTARQLSTLKRTAEVRGEPAAQYYLQNLLGLHKKYVPIHRYQDTSVNLLAFKPKEYIYGEFKALQINDSDADHRPTERSVGNWVGVEIECYFPARWECTDNCDHDNGECYNEFSPSEDECRDTIREALKDAGVTRASVKDDGSLESDDGVPVEVTLLFNAADGFGQLEKTCRVLNDLNCFVNKRCGLHVHLDARHLKPVGAKALSKRLGNALPVLKWVVDKSRHDNNYCRLDVGPFARNHDNRYYAVNTQAYFHYKTIEVRMHGGSTNFKKIKHWIELLRFIGSARLPKPIYTFQGLIDLRLPDYLVEYAENRINQLNPEAWTILSPVPNAEAV